MARHAFYTLAFGIFAAGCVTTGTYDKKVAELTGITADHDRQAKEREAELNTRLDQAQKDLAALRAERDRLQTASDDATALVAQLKQRLEKLGQNVDKLAGERGQLAQGLADAKSRLEELRKEHEAAELRAKAFHDLLAKFQSMIDAGKLKVTLRKGRMIIVLPNDVLFDSGKTSIKADGKAALAQVAKVLATIPDREFLVAGDTDNVPIRTERFPSNWELSTQRAVEVVEFLVSSGMKPESLAAAGYGEFDPVSPNDSAEHRALNRRIEIILQPNLSELPGMPGQAASQTTPASG